jgi:O-antigen/teichoic acid export membrane protein
MVDRYANILQRLGKLDLLPGRSKSPHPREMRHEENSHRAEYDRDAAWARLLSGSRILPGPSLSDHEDSVGRLAVRGAVILSLRTVAIRLIGLVTTIFLARAITPSDFGIIAIGLSVVTLGTFIADAGLGASFITRSEDPTQAQLESLTAVQLLVTSTVAAATAAVGMVLVHDRGDVIAVIAASLPFYVVRTPTIIRLERRLAYATIARIEIVETLVYALYVAGCLISDAGLLAIAGGSVTRAAAGSVVAVRSKRGSFVVPRYHAGELQDVLRFGMAFQASGVVYLARSYVLNFGIIAIAGLSSVGYLGIVDRLMQFPFIVIGSLSRVAFPALSRVPDDIAAADLVRRGTLLIAPLVAAMSAGLVAGCPVLIPAVFGSRWAPAIDLVPGSAFALLLSGPISVTVLSLLLSRGDAKTALGVLSTMSLVWVIATFALLRPLGASGIGWGWLSGALTEAVLLSRIVRRRFQVDLRPTIAIPTCVAAIFAAGGYLLSSSPSANLVTGLLLGAVAASATLGVIAIVQREFYLEARRLVHEHLPTHYQLRI